MDIKKIRKKVNALGQKMICDKNWLTFDDVLFDPKNRLFAHDFFLDELPKKGKTGVVITGINPGGTCEGTSDYIEQAKDWREGPSYNYRSYYAPLRSLVEKSKIGGPILWTELAYCANAKNSRGPKNRTIRYSVNTYLKEQVKLLPDAPILAVGGRAFYLLSFLFPDRLIIGLPHPSGANRIANRAYHHQKPVTQVVGLLAKAIQEAKKAKKEKRTLAVNIAFDKKVEKFRLRED